MGQTSTAYLQASSAPDHSLDVLQARRRSALQREWRVYHSHQLPRHQINWLRGDYGRAAFGEVKSQKMVKKIIDRLLALMCISCSGAWHDAFQSGTETDIPEKMVFSRAMIRDGFDGQPFRRKTPRIAVKIEDMIDLLDGDELDIDDHTRLWQPSNFMHAMERIRSAEGRCTGGW